MYEALLVIAVLQIFGLLFLTYEVIKKYEEIKKK